MDDATGSTRDIFDAGGLGLRHDGLRRANEKAVLTVVAFNAGVSNAEIARLSGLAPQTVSAILTVLETDGLIKRLPVLRGRRGQPATPILVNENGAYSIGVEISWQHVDVVLINFYGVVLAERHADYAYPDAETLFDTIAGMVEEVTAALKPATRSRLRDVGVSMPAKLADHLDLLSAPEHQIALWRAADPVAELRVRTGLDAMVMNDGNASCWAELIALPRPRPANILYFLVSHHVAAGIIGNGALWEGPTGNAANLGSMLVQLDADGPREMHSVASVSALAELLVANGKVAGSTPWRHWDWNEVGPELDIWLERSAKALARTTFNAITVIEQPLLVIDTVLDKAITERLADGLRRELAALPVRGFEPPKVVTGQYGRLAPALGAAELPLYRRYF